MKNEKQTFVILVEVLHLKCGNRLEEDTPMNSNKRQQFLARSTTAAGVASALNKNPRSLSSINLDRESIRMAVDEKLPGMFRRRDSGSPARHLEADKSIQKIKLIERTLRIKMQKDTFLKGNKLLREQVHPIFLKRDEELNKKKT
ncbi:hypothetical protein V1478_015776 [Vespula squamosa]|uniref:Uncharacterized protein n=1 Tax=Vespula squamosa TaxID=30214 RepID=A0ABD2A2H3_VESSQ